MNAYSGALFHSVAKTTETQFVPTVVGNRVVMLLVLNVIVDIHLDRFDGNILVGMFGERCQHWFIQRFKCLVSVAGQLLERLLVKFFQQGANALI